MVGLSVGLEADDGEWRLSLWGRNLGDKRFPALVFGPPFGGPGDYAQVLTGDAFRRFGVTLNLRY